MTERKRGEFRGTRNLRRLAGVSQTKQDEEIRRTLELGLEAAASINDRTISLFSRGHQPAFAGINTFMKAPYCEDVRNVKDYEAAFVGVPFDTGTTYRQGTRFSRRCAGSPPFTMALSSTAESISLRAQVLRPRRVFVIPAISKEFDQSPGDLHITPRAFPIICGGDHSLGFPNVRGIAPHIDGYVGIIHVDRHLDIQEKDMDERMHTTPWYWTTHEATTTTHRDHSHMHDVGLPNCRPRNLVQMGIGGWYGSRPGAKGALRRGPAYDVADIRSLVRRRPGWRSTSRGRAARPFTSPSTLIRSIPASLRAVTAGVGGLCPERSRSCV